MRELDIARSIPSWLTDGRLTLGVSLLREEPSGDANTYDLVKLVQEEPRRQSADRIQDVRFIIDSIIAALRAFERSGDGVPANLASFLDDRLRGSQDAIIKSTVNVTVSQGQAASAVSSQVTDLSALAAELARVTNEARRRGTADIEQMTAIEAARSAADRGDEAAAVGNLRKVAGYVAGLAREVAAPVLTALIESKIGRG
jgi:hypothetical protein